MSLGFGEEVVCDEASSVEDRLAFAEQTKELGNKLLKAGQPGRAAARYANGIEVLEPCLEGHSYFAERELRARCAAVHILLCNNMAQACLRLGQWERAADHADKVLQAEPDNRKALFRRATAALRINSDRRIQQALNDLTRITMAEPMNVEAQEQLECVKERLRSYYDILCIHPEASATQVRQAYRREARRWHPDKACPEDKDVSERRFKQIAEAYEVLNDREKRSTYNLYLECRAHGYVQIVSPDDPHGEMMPVPFATWKEFCQIMESGILPPPGAEMAPAEEEEEAPVSVYEWVVAGGVVVAIWWLYSWFDRRRSWLHALPPEIWRVHSEFSMPVSILLSPIFFGGHCSFAENATWLRSVLGN